MKSVFESFSRCLGTNHGNVPASSNDGRRDSVRRTASSSREYQDMYVSNQGETSTISKAHDSACCGVPLEEYHEHMTDIDRSHAMFLAHARKKAAASNHRSKSKLASYSSSASRRSSLEKARRKSYKRSLDIFRKPPERTSSFSDFFNNAAFPQMLCFANPVLDSEDDEKRHYDDYTVDDETITSTLYFDAKIEHLVENRQPTPLYREFSIMQVQGNADILKIYHSKSHKTIPLLNCEQPPPPPPPLPGPTTSVMDDTSSDEESSDESDQAPYFRPTFLEVQPDDTPNASCIPSPPMCRSRNELDVIEDLMRPDDIPPGLKLISKSSNSSAALTPVCSSMSNNSQTPNYGKSTFKLKRGQTFTEEQEKRMHGMENFRSTNR